MWHNQVALLRYFHDGEMDLSGAAVDFSQYHDGTLQELDKLRGEIGSRCTLIRGNHGAGKETAIDACFPDAAFARVVMALFRSGFSKGIYQGGSIHLDSRMGAGGLARAWMALKPDLYHVIVGRGLGHLRTYSRDGWDYYDWESADSFQLLTELVHLNE